MYSFYRLIWEIDNDWKYCNINLNKMINRWIFFHYLEIGSLKIQRKVNKHTYAQRVYADKAYSTVALIVPE